jgi:hypothetical protein
MSGFKMKRDLASKIKPREYGRKKAAARESSSNSNLSMAMYLGPFAQAAVKQKHLSARW